MKKISILLLFCFMFGTAFAQSTLGKVFNAVVGIGMVATEAACKNPRSISDMKAANMYNPEGMRFTEISYFCLDSRVEKTESLKYYLRYVKPEKKVVYNAAAKKEPYHLTIETSDKTPYNFTLAETAQGVRLPLERLKKGTLETDPEKHVIYLSERQLIRALENNRDGNGELVIILEGDKGESRLLLPDFYLRFVLESTGAIKAVKQDVSANMQGNPKAAKNTGPAARKTAPTRPLINITKGTPAKDAVTYTKHLYSAPRSICNLDFDLTYTAIGSNVSSITIKERKVDNFCEEVNFNIPITFSSIEIEVKDAGQRETARVLILGSTISVPPTSTNKYILYVDGFM